MVQRLGRMTTTAVAVALAVGALTGCGGDDEPTVAADGGSEAAETQAPSETQTPAGSAAGELTVTAVENEQGLAFEPAELSASAGEVTITMDNPEGNEMPHTVAIEGGGVDESGDVVQAGQSASVSAQLEPGEYTYYCPVGQHRQNGMEGTLTVE